MRASVTVDGQFSASHQVGGDLTCSLMHGHTWTVTVTASREIVTSALSSLNPRELLRDVETICRELDHHHLNEMLPGVAPTPEGIAAYVHERLAFEHQNITKVRVGYRGPSSYVAEMEWQIR